MGGGFCPFLPDMRMAFVQVNLGWFLIFKRACVNLSLISPLLWRVSGQYLTDNIVTTHHFKLVVTPYAGKKQQKANTGCFWRGELGAWGIGSLGGKEMYCSLYILLYFLNFEPWAYTIHSKQELNDKKPSRDDSSLQRVEVSCGSEQPGRAGVWPPGEWFWFMSSSESCLVWSPYWRY